MPYLVDQTHDTIDASLPGHRAGNMIGSDPLSELLHLLNRMSCIHQRRRQHPPPIDPAGLQPLLQRRLLLGPPDAAEIRAGRKPSAPLLDRFEQRGPALARKFRVHQFLLEALQVGEDLFELLGSPLRRRRRIVELVGDPGGERTEASHPLTLSESPLRLLLTRDIGAVGENERAPRAHGVRDDQVRAADASLDDGRFGGREYLLPKRFVHCGHEIEPMRARQVFAAE